MDGVEVIRIIEISKGALSMLSIVGGCSRGVVTTMEMME